MLRPDSLPTLSPDGQTLLFSSNARELQSLSHDWRGWRQQGESRTRAPTNSRRTGSARAPPSSSQRFVSYPRSVPTTSTASAHHHATRRFDAPRDRRLATNDNCRDRTRAATPCAGSAQTAPIRECDGHAPLRSGEPTKNITSPRLTAKVARRRRLIPPDEATGATLRGTQRAGLTPTTTLPPMRRPD